MCRIINLIRVRKARKVVRCPITREIIDPDGGYLLTTAQVVRSEKFWDQTMTEPETLAFTLAHFNNDTTGTHMRSLIFEKHSTQAGPWLISETCIDLFAVNRMVARSNARRWWERKGDYVPEGSGPAPEIMPPDELQVWKQYAVLEAGREKAMTAQARFKWAGRW
jgi:hypothetical protein